MISKKVIIAEDTINDIVEESNRHENVETGGLLFGKIIGECIIILKIYIHQLMQKEHKSISKWMRILQ